MYIQIYNHHSIDDGNTKNIPISPTSTDKGERRGISSIIWDHLFIYAFESLPCLIIRTKDGNHAFETRVLKK